MSGECDKCKYYKYQIFMGFDFYPLGGWEDFYGNFESIEKCIEEIKSQEVDMDKWAHVVCDGKIVLKATTISKDYHNYEWEIYFPLSI